MNAYFNLQPPTSNLQLYGLYLKKQPRMEERQPLFSLSIEPITRMHLNETARWARFLAIIGMAFLILFIVGGLVYSIYLSSVLESVNSDYGFRTSYSSSMIAGSAIMFLVVAVISFFPMLYMLRFANRMRKALNANDQEALNSSFQNLKIYFRYIGIITIIGLVLWVLWITIFILGSAALR
jgi:hypothetical protein